MNKIINTFSLTGDKFTKHHERIQKFRDTGNLKHLYTNELAKACFAYDTANSDSEDLVKKTISGKILKDRVYDVARNCKYDRYRMPLANMVFTFLIRMQNRE